MAKNSKKSSDVFEIEKIGDSCSDDNLSKSLIFKISKVSKTREANHESEAFNLRNEVEENKKKRLSSEKLNFRKNNSHMKCEMSKEMRKVAKVHHKPTKETSDPTIEVANKDTFVLRRSSRRIVTRVQKDFFWDIQKFKKKKKSLRKIQKEKLNEFQGEKMTKRRGRPRKNPDQNLSQSANSAPVLLQSKKLNSPCHYSSMTKTNYLQKENCIPSNSESIPSSCSCNNENYTVKWPFFESFMRREQNHPFPYSSSSVKPTVIYFQHPKNQVKLLASRVQEQNPPFQNKFSNVQPRINFSQQEKYLKACLRQKYSMISASTFDYFYDVGHGNVQRVEMLLNDFMSKKAKPFVSNNVSRHLIRTPPPTYHVSRTEKAAGETTDKNYFTCYEPNLYKLCDNSKILHTTNDIDTLCRKVIVNSLRILYDEESVLGYQ